MFFVVFLVICILMPASQAGLKPSASSKELQKLFETVYHNLYVRKDRKLAASLFQSLIPDEARLKMALRPDVSDEVVQKLTEQHQQILINDENIVNLMRPEQSVVVVHAATTEEIARYEQGSVPFQEFPGGAQRVAEQILRKGVTFYEVEFLEPGKDAGVKCHLIYWDGKQWSMLGPAWRVLR